MSAWARKRQAIVISYILLTAIIIAAIFYFFVLYSPPTCFDGERNGTEEGIDCGGTCEVVCAFATTDPNILWARSFKVGPGVYNMAALVENPNFDEGTVIEYSLRGYNEENILVAEINDSVELLPTEKKVIFEPAVETGNQEIERTFLQFESGNTWYNEEQAQKIVATQSYTLDNLETNPSLAVTLKNTSVRKVEDVTVVVVLYNESQNVEQVSRTYVESIPADSTEQAFFSWRTPFDNEITQVEVFVRLD